MLFDINDIYCIRIKESVKTFLKRFNFSSIFFIPDVKFFVCPIGKSLEMTFIVGLNISKLTRVADFLFGNMHLVIEEGFDDMVYVGRDIFDIICTSAVD